MPAFEDSQILNYLVRMVVPLRREFGRSLDVQHFMHDVAYAREVLEEALQSQDPRLREYAAYVQKLLHGPRNQVSTARSAAPAARAPAEAEAEAAPQSTDEEEALRAQIMKKYTSGLR